MDNIAVPMIAALYDQAEAALAKRLDDLTDAEKFAIAFSAGCKIEIIPDPDRPGTVNVRTKNPVAIVDVGGRCEVREMVGST